MILVRKWVLLALYGLLCALTGGLGFYAYTVISGHQATLDAVTKYRAENVIFLVVLSLLVFTVGVILLIRKSTDILAELDKAGDLLRFGQTDLSDYLENWGLFGRKIGTLTRRLERLNAMRALFISSQNGVISFFLENVTLPLCITDARGRITHLSRRFLKKTEIDRDDLLGTELAALVEETDFGALSSQLTAGHSVIRRKDCRMADGTRILELNLAFYPVFNAEAVLSHVICVVEDENIVVELAGRGLQLQKQVKEQGQSIGKRVLGFMRKTARSADGDGR